MKTPAAIVALCLTAAGGTGPSGQSVAWADGGFRCESGYLVDLGDLGYEVQTKCGEPDSVTQRTEKRTVRHKVRRWTNGVAEDVTEERQIDVPFEEWVYDMGPHKLIRVLRFEDDRLIRVTTGRRGLRAR
jgi:hypothetical protein